MNMVMRSIEVSRLAEQNNLALGSYQNPWVWTNKAAEITRVNVQN